MLTELSPTERAKYLCAEKAAELVESGMKVGLGTGSTAYWLVKHLGRKVRDEGLDIEGVPTSRKTSELAHWRVSRLSHWIKLVGWTLP